MEPYSSPGCEKYPGQVFFWQRNHYFLKGTNPLKSSIIELQKRACQIRLELLNMFSHSKAHHFGGSLSCVELVTSLYFYKMKYSNKLANSPERDRFIMSKGHTVPVQYVALAMHGVFPLEELSTIKQFGSRLQGHPDPRKTPGLEAPTGSLGQGLSYANGIALAGRLDKIDFNAYVILGDGELQEGQVWEAAMSTSHFNLGNVCVMVDRNRLQSQGTVSEIMEVEPLEERWHSFGWDTVRVDGHDLEALCNALDGFDGKSEKPLAIIADTVKGKGVKFMENEYKYHNGVISEDELRVAQKDIEQELQNIEMGD